ncbi:uncharacterized protein LOC129411042 [Boleophthalmus pectinirostris]|uniref:uncharacterized protein LOC129411042 n=1 Tax=Boleophthalmus pectinirostris TaxID=150288 RepID=UPI002431B5AB|nr:uncharacterized protein LOC129411042 [Boleophthalmus pectinirostris]
MDIFESLDIKIPNAVIVRGTPKCELDEVEDFLLQYGAIERSVMINSTESEYHEMLVVEFKTTSAFDLLGPILPYKFKPSQNEYCVKNLSKVYAASLGCSKTKTYLADLKQVAKMSGQDFTEVLQELMTQINEAVTELCPSSSQSCTKEQSTAPQHKMATDSVPPRLKMAATPVPSAHNMSTAELNPPEVQRYVVEHIVKSDDIAIRSSHRLRLFSGKVPRPQHEVDYDTWRSAVDLILKDTAISELQRSRFILDSLLPPAADIVKHLSPDLPAEIYIQHLDSAYGTVQDGEELYVKFMDTLQDSGEKPSAYLQRLQVALSLAVKRGGVKQSDVNRHLLSQFCRGCWDNSLISELQLKQRKANPPSFAELLLLLRTEEDREACKAQRMRQHLGTTKQKAAAQAQFVVEEDGVSAALSSLTKQIADIQKQLAALTASQSAQSRPSYPLRGPPVPKLQTRQRIAPKARSSSPKPGFCFRCGEDGHIKPQCENRPNPALVSSKRKQFNDKKQRWQPQNQYSNEHLN